jgi:hypothetical protein
MKNLLKISALALALVATANVAGAQASISGTAGTTLNASAAVGASIDVSSSPLDFGTIYRNQAAKTILATDANPGFFLITGTGGTQVTATAVLPTDLHSFLAGADLPITFYLGQATGSGVCTAAFVNAGQILLSGAAGATGTGKLCIGGQVAPTTTQAIAADYTAAVTFTIDFP